MPRDVDERKKRRALRKLRRAADLAEQGLGPPLSDWEQTFLEELEERIETYGSAFADPTKGDLSEPLSALQQRKLKEIDKKARGKAKPPKRPGKTSLRRRSTEAPADEEPTPVSEDEPTTSDTGPPAAAPRLVRSKDRPDRAPGPAEPPAAPPSRPAFRVIEGGKTD